MASITTQVLTHLNSQNRHAMFDVEFDDRVDSPGESTKRYEQTSMASRQLSRVANMYRQYMTTQLSEEATEVISSDPASPTI